MAELTDMRVLIVDDNLANIEVAEQILQRAGYVNTLNSRDPEAVMNLCEAWNPDLLMLDLHMPGLSGFQVLGQLRKWIGDPYNLPVLVVTADIGPDASHRALSMGARDFITKPIDQVELLLRVRNLLQTRQLQHQLEERNAHLDQTVRERTDQLEQAHHQSLLMLAALGEYHDDDTHHHTQRVGDLAAAIATNLDLPDDFVVDILQAAPLHDIGKIAVPREVLRKPAALTDRERATMKCHVEVGARILGAGSSAVLRLATEIARTHHERWDGTGYLEGLAGVQIPIAGRITAVADLFDALVHERPYKEAWDVERALTEIRDQSGHQFDPNVVEAFLRVDIANLRG